MFWLIRFAIVGAMWLMRRHTGRNSPALLQDVNALSWPAKARLTWRLIRDTRVPKWARGLAFLPALYLMSPIDLLPDFIPVIGRLDDALVFGLVSDQLLRFVPADVLQEHVAALAKSKR